MSSVRNGDLSPSFQLDRNAWGEMVLTDSQGRRFVDIEVVRAFPITDPRRSISICDADGAEILCIDDLDEVPTPMRQRLEDELARRHFLPRIQLIGNIVGVADPTTWEVATDRGMTRFTVQSEEDVRRLGAPNRVLIIDSHGIRYLIPDVNELDSRSKRLLSRYI